jgi:predicted helicase
MSITEYLEILKTRFKSGISKEHSYRGDLETLIRTIVSGVEITNEPSQVTDCGNPDYVITKGKIPIGYIEAKDIGKDLNGKQYNEQFSRYKKALDNLVITDYIWFQFFQHGELVHEIKIGEIDNNTIKPITDNFKQFENLIQNFCTFIGQTIKSPKRLAEMMAAKARLLENILEKAITTDEENQENTSIKEQYETFKAILIHDLTPKGFADIYAQTLAYGMFAARLHDTTLDDFSRYEAAQLIPKTNPFLRRLFEYIAGANIDERIVRTVDNLADVFRATNVDAMLNNFGKSTQTEDPIIHFYETFLSEYDPKLRKSRGVWFTPQPVVNFIVRAVDDILKTDFNLKDGLADTTKTKIKLATQTKDKRTATGFKEVEKEVHKVQILDPATGTGTFLAEVVKFIYNKRFTAMQGVWSSYVDEHLIPRLNGFELLMASYSMAHLKLDMLLRDTGYKATINQRFNIYLTNSLEEHHADTGTIFSNWLSTEANEANHIKKDTPVMCVIGNPPYSVSSTNKGEWIQNLISEYKQDLNERKINLDDDYIKFIRYGEFLIEKNGEGVLAFISNNSFLDGTTHRQMRKHLLETFDKIYILDLHGNSRKREASPDGSIDQNVFDIMAGVSINIFIKKGKKKKENLGKVYHLDLFGRREVKYDFLLQNSINQIDKKCLNYKPPYYFFVPKDFALEDEYIKGFSLDELFNFNTSGFETAKDKFIIKFKQKEVEDLRKEIKEKPVEELSVKYSEKPKKIKEVKDDINNATLINALYRPFDKRYTLISENSNGVMFRPRFKTVHHLLNDNIGLLCCKRQTSFNFQHAFVTKNAVERCSVSLQTGEVSIVFPLYLYPESDGQKSIDSKERELNLNLNIISKIEDSLNLKFITEQGDSRKTFDPFDLFDYIYAVLHSPTYREKYKEFLKIDFPRVPYPKNPETFRQLVKLGGELRQIHLLESPITDKYITQYPVDGDNIVGKIRFEPYVYSNEIPDENGNIEYPDYLGTVFINETQCFNDVPTSAWEFYIGGYQPAQKWLKDRKNRKLEFDDILHYQKIIVALTETNRLMKEIDKINIE